MMFFNENPVNEETQPIEPPVAFRTKASVRRARHKYDTKRMATDEEYAKEKRKRTCTINARRMKNDPDYRKSHIERCKQHTRMYRQAVSEYKSGKVADKVDQEKDVMPMIQQLCIRKQELEMHLSHVITSFLNTKIKEDGVSLYYKCRSERSYTRPDSLIVASILLIKTAQLEKYTIDVLAKIFRMKQKTILDACDDVHKYYVTFLQ